MVKKFSRSKFVDDNKIKHTTQYIPRNIPGGPPSSPPKKAPPPAAAAPLAECFTATWICLLSEILQQSPIISSIPRFIVLCSKTRPGEEKRLSKSCPFSNIGRFQTAQCHSPVNNGLYQTIHNSYEKVLKLNNFHKISKFSWHRSAFDNI